jgi:hypothetical protein
LIRENRIISIQLVQLLELRLLEQLVLQLLVPMPLEQLVLQLLVLLELQLLVGWWFQEQELLLFCCKRPGQQRTGMRSAEFLS